jgi:hypothetical protein
LPEEPDVQAHGDDFAVGAVYGAFTGDDGEEERGEGEVEVGCVFGDYQGDL